jgi:hypothetical protein
VVAVVGSATAATAAAPALTLFPAGRLELRVVRSADDPGDCSSCQRRSGPGKFGAFRHVAARGDDKEGDGVIMVTGCCAGVGPVRQEQIGPVRVLLSLAAIKQPVVAVAVAPPPLVLRSLPACSHVQQDRHDRGNALVLPSHSKRKLPLSTIYSVHSRGALESRYGTPASCCCCCCCECLNEES